MDEHRTALLEIRDVEKHYESRRGLLDEALRRPPKVTKAVDGLSFTIEDGEIVGLVGESGSGKTVTGEMLVGLQRPTRGTIRYRGRDIFGFPRAEYKRFRRQAQMVFQDPYETLNPRFTVYRTLADPLDVHRLHRGPDRRRHVIAALEECGLRPGERFLDRYPFLLSGGERQRVAVARALVLEPSYLVADEPTSMLDVSIRAGVLELLRALNRRRGVTIVFITHDLAAVREVADRVVVMYLGGIVEIAPTAEVLGDPFHPYTRGLIAAVPRLDGDPRDAYQLQGEIPDPTAVPSGCRFEPRCDFRESRCAERPELRRLAGTRWVACHCASARGGPWRVGDRATSVA